MTKRHFELIAEAFAAENYMPDDTEATANVLRRLADRLANEFRAENPRFDTARFMKACGFDQ